MAFENRIDPKEAEENLSEWLTRRLSGPDDVRIFGVDVPAASGLSCETVLFDAAWTENGAERQDELVARVAPVGHTGLFPSYDLEREARIMRALSEHTDVPAPHILFSETDESVLGGPFVVMDRIRGRVPSDDPPYTLEGWVLDLTPAQQRRMIDSAVDTVAAMARVEPGAVGLEDLDRAGLDQQIGYFEHLYEDGNRGNSHAVPEAGLQWLRDNAPQGEPLRVCWGDARIGNMLFADDCSVAGALDWEVASLGSPEADIGYFLFALRLWSEGFGAPSPPGFPQREEIIARFERKSGHTLEHLDYYERFGCVFGAVMIMRGGYHMIEAGLLPPDSSMPVANPGSVMLAEYLGVPAPTGEVTDWAGKR
jgi:aminoglycoside phosphotransferase (APT) family kinase protein